MFDSTMKQFHSITKFFITFLQVFSRCDTKWWICKILYLQWMQLKWEDLDFSVLLNCCRFLAWLFTKCEIPKFSVATIVVTKRISKIPQTLDQDTSIFLRLFDGSIQKAITSLQKISFTTLNTLTKISQCHPPKMIWFCKSY